MTAITIKGLTKRFGSTVAVDGVNLTINSGELFFLLGPSGCGKTTLLRMIAGFIEPSAGSIRFADRDVTLLPPNRRNTGMVFQSYALWPHMTVEENVAYGLNVRKVPADQRTERVMSALKSVHMEEFARRKPNQLSGGQQQRVALARALVIEPTVLLLDEPLSNLDAKLRLEMREEIRRICTETKITTVYVTHDQKEALSMADNMAVLRNGKIVQSGPPRLLYDRPNSRFVADFLGETNFLPAVIVAISNGVVKLETSAGVLESRMIAHDSIGAGAGAGAGTSREQIENINPPVVEPEIPATPQGGNVTCSIRPEAIRISSQPGTTNSISGRRVRSIFLGDMAQHIIELPDGTQLRAMEMNPNCAPTGDRVTISIDPSDVIILAD